MSYMNCWEFKKCEGKANGGNEEKCVICTALEEEKFDQINHGKNGGRICWLIRQRSVGRKEKGLVMAACSQCDFYKLVEKEEESQFLAYP